MKLRSLTISNILSFKYESNFAACETINFHESLNILVGPNGSGKSNMLEVINYLFHHILFKPCKYEEERIEMHRTDAEFNKLIKNTISLDRAPNHQVLAPNVLTPLSPSTIKIALTFNEDDRRNMHFVYENAPSINAFISKYSNESVQFKSGFNANFMNVPKELELLFERKQNDSVFRWPPAPPIAAITFIHQYLEYFELLQAVILVANKEENVVWPLLKDTFAIIGCYRNYESYNGGIKAEGSEHTSLRQTTQKVREQSARSLFSGEPAVFELVKKKIAFKYAELKDKKGKVWADEQIQEFHLFKNIRELIRVQPLHLDMKIDRASATSLDFEVQFVDLITNKPAFVHIMSGGQKNLLHLVFSLFGFDNPNGLIVIDEPELHLHLQSQQQYLDILGQVSKAMQIQFIVVTHSSAFIQPSHIYYIYRFYLREGFTEIIHPEITESDRQLLQIITLTNAAKIFFGERIILVEGDTDEYFYRFMLSELVMEGQVPHGTEIINIQGKGNYSVWKGFLEKFAMPCYFIGDWDNVIEFGLLSERELTDYAKKAQSLRSIEKGILKKDSRDRIALADLVFDVCANPSPENLAQLQDLGNFLVKRYISCKEILQYISETNPAVLARIKSKIEKLKSRHIYLLPNGELEDYLPIEKGMEAIIEFVKTDYFKWKETHPLQFNSIRELLTQIANPTSASFPGGYNFSLFPKHKPGT